jgi:G3E family GTPase
VARSEPDLSYAGIVTLVDGLNFETILQDERVAPQLEAQVRVADMVYVTKIAKMDAALNDTLSRLSAKRIVTDPNAIGPLLWASDYSQTATPAKGHAHFARWFHEGPESFSRSALLAHLTARPEGLFRVKGFVRNADGARFEAQVVGKDIALSQAEEGVTQLVGIGVEGSMTDEEINAWWAKA